MEIDRDIGKAVASLFVRQLDVQTHGFPFHRSRSPVCRFHNSRAAPGYDREIVFCQAFCQFDCRLVIGVLRQHSGRAKTVTPGPTCESASKESTNSAIMRKIRHGSSLMNEMCVLLFICAERLAGKLPETR